MKKISIMLLAALMLFAFVACEDNKETPASEAQVADLAAYVDQFGHKAAVIDIDTMLLALEEVSDESATVASVDSTLVFDKTNSSWGDKEIKLVFEAKNHEIDAPDYRTVSGDITLTLKGETKPSKFEAATYTVDASSLKFSLTEEGKKDNGLKDLEDMTVAISGLTGKFVTVGADNKTTDTPLEISATAQTTSDNYKAFISNDVKNAAKFGFPTAGTIKIGDATVALDALEDELAK